MRSRPRIAKVRLALLLTPRLPNPPPSLPPSGFHLLAGELIPIAVTLAVALRFFAGGQVIACAIPTHVHPAPSLHLNAHMRVGDRPGAHLPPLQVKVLQMRLDVRGCHQYPHPHSLSHR